MRKLFFSLLKSIHARLVLSRRVSVLSDALQSLVPDGASVLDIGCGNGSIGKTIMLNKSATVRGLEVLPRPDCLIDCMAFDGKSIPLPEKSVDISLLVDVLHHSDDISGILAEACRVSRGTILIKDHLCESKRDSAILKFMDWIGNRHHDVALPYNYLSRKQWEECFASHGLSVARWIENIRLYPVPFQSLFGRNLHFIALLKSNGNSL